MNFYLNINSQHDKTFFKKRLISDLISVTMMSDRVKSYTAICKDFNVNKAWKCKFTREIVLAEIFQDMMKTHHGSGKIKVTFSFTRRNFKKLLKRYGKSLEVIQEEISKFMMNEAIQDKDNDHIYTYNYHNSAEMMLHLLELYSVDVTDINNITTREMMRAPGFPDSKKMFGLNACKSLMLKRRFINHFNEGK